MLGVARIIKGRDAGLKYRGPDLRARLTLQSCHVRLINRIFRSISRSEHGILRH